MFMLQFIAHGHRCLFSLSCVSSRVLGVCLTLSLNASLVSPLNFLLVKRPRVSRASSLHVAALLLSVPVFLVRP